MDEKERRDGGKLSGARKAAMFLLNMGEGYSSEIFKKMTNSEIKKIAAAMAQIEQISPNELTEISREFVGLYEGESKLVVESGSFLKSVIERTLDPERAEMILR
jgi:flagellar motor switch protein FliG